MNAMSDPRRLTFTTIGPMGKEKKKKSSLPPTIRFTLALRESNDKTCPEFSFADLMKNALGVCKNTDANDFDLEDQNENERLVALAKSFEERYGPKHSKPQSKRLDAIQDLVDLGEGYDETDPFVDNSEAYDELVPACLTTKLGGFYINSGVLDFRDVSDDSSDEYISSPLKKRKKAKRVITSDPESDGEVKKKVPEINKIKEEANNEVKKKVSGEKEFKKPRKPTSKEIFRKKSSSTVKELLKNAVSTSSSTSNNGHIDETNGNIYSQTSPVGVLSQEKSSTNIGVYTASLPPVISSAVARQEVLKLELGSTENPNINNFKEDSDSRDNDDNKFDIENIPKLSAGIPDHLEKIIYQLKQAAVDCMGRKSKFFTSEINKMLLELEMGSRVLNCSQRTSVYAYLAAFLPFSKETLLKHVKKLFITQDDKLKPVQKLKEALTEEVPDQLEKYKSECQTIIKNVDFNTPDDEEMKEDSSDDEEEKSPEEIEKTSLQKDYEWNEKMRILYKKSKVTYGSTSQIKPTKAMCNLRSQDISAGTATTGSHSNSSPTLQTDSLIACQQNAKADVTPILTTLANEMMDHSPTASERTEDKSLWNVLDLEYVDTEHRSSTEENLSDSVQKSQLVSSALHKTSQEENFGKGEKLNPNESSKTVHEISGNVNTSSGSTLLSISSSSHLSSHVNVTHGSPFSNQNTSPQISPTIPSVKVNYSQHSPTTPLSIKNHQHGTSSSSQSQGHTSSSKQPGGEQQKLPSHIGNVHSKSIQQSSPPGVVTSDSQNYHGYVDAMSVMVDPQLQQHNGQTTSNTNSKPQQVSSMISSTYPNVKSKDSSQSNVQNKLTINMASKILKTSGIKGSSKKDTTALAAGSSEKSQNSDSKSSAQFSKDDSKNTYLAEFQRYAASCLVSKSGAPAQKGKTQPNSTAASKAVDERCQVQQQQHRNTTNQLSHSLTTSSVHPTGKIEAASTQQRNLHHTHSPQQQQQQQSSLQHQKQQQQQQQQQQHQKLHQQQNVVHGMSQSIGHSHSNKSHLSSHASKSWRHQQQQQQQSSQQHHNRHQQQHQQKSYSSLVSSKQLTSSSQVVNPTNCQSSQQQQQNHSKILSSSLQFQTTQQQQQQQTSRAISPHTSTTSLVKAECSSKHQPSSSQCQSSSVVPATRHSQPRQSSNAVTSSSSCSKSVSSPSSSQRTHIHSLYSTSSTHSTQSPSLKQQQQQSKSQCLISTEKILTASTVTHPTSTSPGSMYTLPTTPNISSSSGTVPTQPSSSSTHTAASVSQHQQIVVRSQQNLHHQRTGILPIHVMGTQAKSSSSNSCNTSSGTTTSTTASANAVSVSTSRGKSSAFCSSWNLSGSNPQVPATSVAASTVASSASASSNRTSSPVFNSTSYLQQQLSSGSHPQLKQQQVQHGSVSSNRVSTAANFTRTVSGLNQENLQPHSGSIHPAQVNQDNIRHSKSE